MTFRLLMASDWFERNQVYPLGLLFVVRIELPPTETQYARDCDGRCSLELRFELTRWTSQISGSDISVNLHPI